MIEAQRTGDFSIGASGENSTGIDSTEAFLAFVATNSVHQGRQVARFWPSLLAKDLEIFFADRSFKWANLAAKKAAVTVSVIGVARVGTRGKVVFDSGMARKAAFIGPYLLPDISATVEESRQALSDLPPMLFGSMPNDGGALLLSLLEARALIAESPLSAKFIRQVAGTEEFVKGIERRCIWVRDNDILEASSNPVLRKRFDRVAEKRRLSTRPATAKLAAVPYRFGEVRQDGTERVCIIAKTGSESREYLPAQLLPDGAIVTEAFALLNYPLWSVAIVSSRLHLAWASTVCGKMKSDIRYSNTLGWNTFPIPILTDKMKADLTRSAEAILLAREAHFPATIADLYDPEAMPADLRAAHERNDDVLERIYIGRRFRNDTERLEKLFELYTQMTAAQPPARKRKQEARA